ncbi:hypothetical protein CEXT_1601 [Caerostris extrusa]|uniref:Uncharacterized protein n=1 Tax=Caerostris extrusa TaxID=172846 RepID=A0AAV4TDM8_CAEEX|nr:hypothetical protein CEXT_1601 [Caerostris extrusa]
MAFIFHDVGYAHISGSVATIPGSLSSLELCAIIPFILSHVVYAISEFFHMLTKCVTLDPFHMLAMSTITGSSHMLAFALPLDPFTRVGYAPIFDPFMRWLCVLSLDPFTCVVYAQYLWDPFTR